MSRHILPETALLLLTAVAFPVVASTTPDIHPMQDVVRKSFESDENAGFKVRTKGRTYVEVCGDTCAYFKWSGDANDERFWRFIVLYEMKDGPGTDVAAFARNVEAMKGRDVVDRTFCSMAGDELSSTKCNWDAYSKSLKIEVGHSRYDEGNRCYSMIVDWQKMTSSQWKCAPMKPGESPFE